VLCGNCRGKLTDFDSEPLTPEDLSRMLSGPSGRRYTTGAKRERETGGRYPCKCGADWPVRLDKMRRAYWRALRGRTDQANVIVLPFDVR
jgi:hypothetical protein